MSGENELISVKKKTTFDKLRDWYSGEESFPLTKKEEEIRVRWEKAWCLLCTHRSPHQVALIISKGPDVEIAQAYRDVKNATRFFGDINKTSKEGKRYVLYELAFNTYQRAQKSGNLTEENKALSNMIKISGVDRDDPDIPDYSSMDMGLKEIVIPEEILAFMTRGLSKGVVDVSKLRESDIEDVDFNLVSDEEE